MRLLSGSLGLQALAVTSDVDPWWPLDKSAHLQSWLRAESSRWLLDDPAFAAQRAIGCAELAAGAAYQARVRRHHEAAAAYEASPSRSDIVAKESALSGGDKAIAGLRAFVSGGSDEDDEALCAKRQRAEMKLALYAGDESERLAAVEAAHAGCPEWQELQAAAADLEAAREALGLPALSAAARALERQKGVEANKGGRVFERAAGEPLLALAALDSGDSSLGKVDELIVLNGVTLGMSKAEIGTLPSLAAISSPTRVLYARGCRRAQRSSAGRESGHGAKGGVEWPLFLTRAVNSQSTAMHTDATAGWLEAVACVCIHIYTDAHGCHCGLMRAVVY